MAHTLILAFHIVVGVCGVILGPAAIAGAVSGRHEPTRLGWAGEAYHGAVLAVCISAAGLALLDPAGLWWFLPIAAGSYAFALQARLAIRRRRPGWQRRSVSGFGGAYISLWTAILVVSANGTPLLWLAPTLAGVPLVEWLARRVREPGPQPTAPATA
jgi:hypothetical protein